MRYMIIGAGGTGGAIGAFLARAGFDVTLIARGEHLSAIREKGLLLHHPDGDFVTRPEACTMEDFIKDGRKAPDVAFVCVKGYSIESAADFLKSAADTHTVVIPILNVYGTGGRLQKALPGMTVTDGCIYIFGERRAPGEIFMNGKMIRIVFGLRRDTPEKIKERVQPVLDQVEKELIESGIRVVNSQQVEADTYRKFTLISPMAAVGAAYDTTAEALQEGGAHRDDFKELVRELLALAEKQAISLPEDMLQKNLDIVDHSAKNATTSMQRDIKAGHESEVDGLVYAVVRRGKELGVPLPRYEEIADILHKKLD